VAWIAVMTRPNQEMIACANLQRQGYAYYMPKFWHRHAGKAILKPLFPRYIFVNIDQTWHSLKSTRGVSYVLMGRDRPQVIPQSIIDSIKAREDAKGVFQMAEPEKFKKGEKVKATEGPLVGLPLIYDGMSGTERVKVLAEMLGRTVVVELGESQIIAA